MRLAASLWEAGIKAEFGYKVNPKMADQVGARRNAWRAVGSSAARRACAPAQQAPCAGPNLRSLSCHPRDPSLQSPPPNQQLGSALKAGIPVHAASSPTCPPLPLAAHLVSLVPQLGYALKAGIPFMVLFGEAELAAGVYKVKDLDAGTEEALPQVRLCCCSNCCPAPASCCCSVVPVGCRRSGCCLSTDRPTADTTCLLPPSLTAGGAGGPVAGAAARQGRPPHRLPAEGGGRRRRRGGRGCCMSAGARHVFGRLACTCTCAPPSSHLLSPDHPALLIETQTHTRVTQGLAEAWGSRGHTKFSRQRARHARGIGRRRGCKLACIAPAAAVARPAPCCRRTRRGLARRRSSSRCCWQGQGVSRSGCRASGHPRSSGPTPRSGRGDGRRR